MNKTVFLSLFLLVWSSFLPALAQVRLAQAEEQKAVLLCVPGLTENPITLNKLACEMAPFGITTYAVDVPGYEICARGKKQEPVDFDKTVILVKETAHSLRLKNPGVPVFLLGESTGGAIAIKVAARYPQCLDGLICTVPTLHVRNKLQIGILQALDVLILRTKRHGLAANYVIRRTTEKQEVRDVLMAAESRRQRFSPWEAFKFVRFIHNGPKTATQIKDLPVLFVHGLLDRVSEPNGCAKLFSKISSEKKTFIIDADAGHLICEEGQYSQSLFFAMKKWIVRAIEKDLPTRPEGFLISSGSVEKDRKKLVRDVFVCAGVTPTETIARHNAGQISNTR